MVDIIIKIIYWVGLFFLLVYVFLVWWWWRMYHRIAKPQKWKMYNPENIGKQVPQTSHETENDNVSKDLTKYLVWHDDENEHKSLS